MFAAVTTATAGQMVLASQFPPYGGVLGERHPSSATTPPRDLGIFFPGRQNPYAVRLSSRSPSGRSGQGGHVPPPAGGGGGGDGSSSYIIKGGRAGSDRLSVLADATWSTSKAFLLRAGLKADMKCLDVACGNGEISLRVAQIIGSGGSILGIDMDSAKIEIAEQKARDSGTHHANFRVFNLETDKLDSTDRFDFIYLRFILSHLKYPQVLLTAIKPHLSPNGIIAIEDVEFDGHYCRPECEAFSRYVALYKELATRRGADANIGPKLVKMVEDAGYDDMKVSTVIPEFRDGDGKQMALITMEAIGASAVAAGLATQDEIDQILNDLKSFTEDTGTVMSIPRFFQITGKL